jgi:hypothetical protein
LRGFCGSAAALRAVWLARNREHEPLAIECGSCSRFLTSHHAGGAGAADHQMLRRPWLSFDELVWLSTDQMYLRYS